MGKMALGYGSEFHLLRWTGRHRNKFDNKIKQLLNIDNITWLDFDFSKNKNEPDKELVGLSFLEKEPSYKAVISQWKEEWPQSGNSMNWDLVGYTVKNNIKTWVLIEAKAHIGELENDCKAVPKSLIKIGKALNNTANNIGTEILIDSPWSKKYYQLANRIYILDLLKRNNINSKLINIYFIGDKIGSSRKSPKDIATWKVEIDKMKKYLNIEKSNSIDILDLYLDINK
ncbi:MAG TPA: hypothetical protein DCM02_05225 [Flavobacterium sp.]|nr:hypothetical protein [Flavobacterium sp.]